MHKKLRYRRPEGGVTMLDFVKFRTRVARSVFELQCRAPPHSTRNFKLYNTDKERKKYSANWLRKMEKTAKIGTFSGWSGDAPPTSPLIAPYFFWRHSRLGGWYHDEIIRLAKKFVDKIFFGAPLTLGSLPPPKIFFSPKFLQRCILLSNVRYVFKFQLDSSKTGRDTDFWSFFNFFYFLYKKNWV